MGLFRSMIRTCFSVLDFAGGVSKRRHDAHDREEGHIPSKRQHPTQLRQRRNPTPEQASHLYARLHDLIHATDIDSPGALEWLIEKTKEEINDELQRADQHNYAVVISPSEAVSYIKKLNGPKQRYFSVQEKQRGLAEVIADIREHAAISIGATLTNLDEKSGRALKCVRDNPHRANVLYNAAHEEATEAGMRYLERLGIGEL